MKFSFIVEKNIIVLIVCMIAFFTPIRFLVPELSILLLIVWLVFRKKNEDFQFFTGEKRKIFILGMLFFGWVIFTSFFREGFILDEIVNGCKYIGIFIFPFAFWNSDILQKKNSIKRIAFASILSYSVICFYSVIAAYFFGDWYYSQFLDKFPATWFSSFLLVNLLLSVYYAIVSKKYKYFYIFSAILFLWSIYLLSFRRHYLAVLISLCVFVFFYFLWNKFSKYIFLLFIFLIISLGTLFFSNDRIGSLAKEGRVFEDIRTQMWKVAWDLLNKSKKSMILGYGVENVQIIYSKEMQKNQILSQLEFSKRKNSCHNDYLDVALQYGIIGLFLILIFYGSFVMYAIKEKNIYLLVFLVFYFSQALFGSYFFNIRAGKIAFFFWLFYFSQFNNKKLLEERKEVEIG